MTKYYAVAVGRSVGVFNSWDDAKRQVDGYPKARHKSFKSSADAEEWLAANSRGAQAQPAAGTATRQLKRSRDEWSELDASARPPVSHQRTDSARNDPGAWPNPRWPEVLRDQGLAAAAGLAPTRQQQQAPPAAVLNQAPGYSRALGARIEGPLLPIKPGVVYRLEFDGASRSNPGPAGAGAQLVEDESGQLVGQLRQYLGRATNNEAEYGALIGGLKMARDFGVRLLRAQGDSQLVVFQVLRRWRAEKPHLQVLRDEVHDVSGAFDMFEIKHVLRHLNTAADALSNEAIDWA